MNKTYVEIIQNVMAFGSEANGTMEVLGFNYRLPSANHRLVTMEKRKLVLPFAIGEFLWLMTGRNNVEPLAFFVPRMRDYSSKGVITNAYGPLIEPYLEEFVNKLGRDKGTRQAVMTIYSPRMWKDKDIACTLSLQAIERDGNLYWFTNMRSQDMIWGLPYDTFQFSMLHEWVARELGLSASRYHGYAASAHIYHRHYQMATEIVSSSDSFIDYEMGEMPRTGYWHFHAMADMYERLVAGEEQSLIDVLNMEEPYWRDLMLVVAACSLKERPLLAYGYTEAITDATIRGMATGYLMASATKKVTTKGK